MVVVVYRNNGEKFVELFRVDGKNVSNDYGRLFLENMKIPVDEDEVFKILKSNMAYVVVRE